MNLLIVRNNSNSQAIDASLLLATYLGTQGIGYAIFDSSDLEGLDPNPLVSQQLARGVDLAVVLGGDGTILRTAPRVSRFWALTLEDWAFSRTRATTVWSLS